MTSDQRPTMPWTSAAHLREWIKTESALVIDSAVSAQFAGYLESLPWAGTHVDWRVLCGSRLSLVGEPDVLEWARYRRIGRHPYALIVHSPSEPALAASLRSVLNSIDLLAWQAAAAISYVAVLICTLLSLNSKTLLNMMASKP